jgi:hypothetical protein
MITNTIAVPAATNTIVIPSAIDWSASSTFPIDIFDGMTCGPAALEAQVD